MWISAAPLAWLVLICYWAALEKIFSAAPRVGFLALANQLSAALAAGKIPAEQIAATKTQIFNNQLDAVVCAIFLVLVTTILIDSIRLWYNILTGGEPVRIMESPFVPSAGESMARVTLSGELADENAYARHLTNAGAIHSRREWWRFWDHRLRAKYMRAKCC